MRIFLFLSILVVVAACSPKAKQVATPNSPASVATGGRDKTDSAGNAPTNNETTSLTELTGLFRIDDGRYEFSPCSDPQKSYWILGQEEKLEQLYGDATLQGYAGQSVMATLAGNILASSPSRGAAKSSPYDAQFEVAKVIKLRPKNARNTCVPYEFWGFGNEPFWDIQISEQEGLIELNMLGQTTKRFDYAKPTVEQDGKLMRYFSPGTTQRIKISIYEEECLDNMAGNRFSHRIEVDYAGKQLKGCARDFKG